MKTLILLAVLAVDGGTPDVVPPARQFSHDVELADGGTLPPGVYFPQPTYDVLDSHVRELQQQEKAADMRAVLAGTVVGLVVGIVTGCVLGYVIGKQ